MLITKPVICQYCHELMEYVKKDEFWKCANCGGEFWLLDNPPIDIKKAVAEEQELVSMSYHGIAKKGSRSSKKFGTKEKLKKKPVSQLFREL